MYSARAISKFIINHVNNIGKTITNLHLQKILYFLQVEKLGTTGEQLFSDPIEKWKLGPVVPTIYHDYKMFGSNTIHVDNFAFGEDVGEVINDDALSATIIDVIERWIDKDAFDLVRITHQHKAWEKDQPKIMNGAQITYTKDELLEAYKEMD